MIWIAKPINSALGRIILLAATIFGFYSWGLAGLAFLMFVISPIHFWAEKKVKLYNRLHPPKPKAPKPLKVVTYEKPVPVASMLVAKRKIKSRRGSSVGHYADQLETLPMPLLELVYDGFSGRYQSHRNEQAVEEAPQAPIEAKPAKAARPPSKPRAKAVKTPPQLEIVASDAPAEKTNKSRPKAPKVPPKRVTSSPS